MQHALDGLWDVGVEMGNEENMCYLDIADDAAWLFESADHTQHALD